MASRNRQHGHHPHKINPNSKIDTTAGGWAASARLGAAAPDRTIVMPRCVLLSILILWY
jgi:hypothetical protein